MKRVVLVGSGARGIYSFLIPLRDELADEVSVVGVYDPNPKRLAAAASLMESELPAFDDFDAMLAETRPDGVIVTSVDATHARYVVTALERGLDVWSEKPLCTSVEQVAAIRRAAAASSGTGYVTHNVRFLPDMSVLKQHIVDGSIGEVLHIDFAETLDRYHGADYFRRWHRFMANSAGLMVHKSSHHFDIINWLAAARPRTVSAHGRLAFYGARGPFRGERCSTCPHAESCDFHADVFADERLERLYHQAESVDGYYRDGCVFDARIDIPDTISTSITYDNGIIANYSLVAYASYESMRIAVEGTRGRLELLYNYGTDWAVGRKDGEAGESVANDGHSEDDARRVLLYEPHSQRRTDIATPLVKGGHGGADPRLRAALFSAAPPADPLGCRAELEEGIQAVLVGLAANASMAQGNRPIDVQALTPPVA